MNTTKTTAGLSAAIAAAALFLAAPIAQAGTSHAAGTSTMGHCMGANACKGQGFTMATVEQCKTASGRFEMPKSDDKAEPAKQAQG